MKSWLIEKSHKDHYNGPMYYAMSVESGDGEYWTTDPYKAVRFARQQDAHDVMRGFNISLATAVEHGFDERYKVEN